VVEDKREELREKVVTGPAAAARVLESGANKHNRQVLIIARIVSKRWGYAGNGKCDIIQSAIISQEVFQ